MDSLAAKIPIAIIMTSIQVRKRFATSKLQLFQLPEHEREKFFDSVPQVGIFPKQFDLFVHLLNIQQALLNHNLFENFNVVERLGSCAQSRIKCENLYNPNPAATPEKISTPLPHG